MKVEPSALAEDDEQREGFNPSQKSCSGGNEAIHRNSFSEEQWLDPSVLGNSCA
jgi:hypothetical protein